MCIKQLTSHPWFVWVVAKVLIHVSAVDADAENAGLVPRALKDLFAKLSRFGGEEEDRQHCRICMSYVEIYNERLHDLLQPYKPNARLDPQVIKPNINYMHFAFNRDRLVQNFGAYFKVQPGNIVLIAFTDSPTLSVLSL